MWLSCIALRVEGRYWRGGRTCAWERRWRVRSRSVDVLTEGLTGEHRAAAKWQRTESNYLAERQAESTRAVCRGR